MANFNARQSGPAQAARPSAAEAKADRGALQHLPEPDVQARRGREQGGPHHARPTSWSISASGSRIARSRSRRAWPSCATTRRRSGRCSSASCPRPSPTGACEPMSLAHDGTILLTGAAGFIGYHLADRLLRDGCRVVGVDSLNDYYDPRLKQARLDRLQGRAGLQLRSGSTSPTAPRTPALFAAAAAQGGGASRGPGRRALLAGEPARLCRRQSGRASSTCSRAAGTTASRIWSTPRPARSTAPTRRMPFSVHDNVDHPLSLYAATKKANELMAHTYSHLYGLPVTGLRFFTVYGPWGRPDMALFLFTEAMLAGRPIRGLQPGPDAARLHLHRRHRRGRAPGRSTSCPTPDPAWSGAQPDPGTSRAPYRLYNIGNHQPVELMHLIATLERALGVTAVKELLPMQPGDVPATYADIEDLTRATGFTPATPIEDGRRAVRALVPRRVAQDRRLSGRGRSVEWPAGCHAEWASAATERCAWRRAQLSIAAWSQLADGIETLSRQPARGSARASRWPIRERLGGWLSALGQC